MKESVKESPLGGLVDGSYRRGTCESALGLMCGCPHHQMCQPGGCIQSHVQWSMERWQYLAHARLVDMALND